MALNVRARNAPLITDRLILRRFLLDDAEFMLAIWNDPAFIRYVGDRRIRTPEAAANALREGILKVYDDYGYGPMCVVAKDGGARVGICGLFRREGLEGPDLGFALLPQFRGKGLAGEAAAAVIEHTRDILGLVTLSAIVAPQNTASVGLLDRLGFSFEKKMKMPGDAHAVDLYRIAFGDREESK